jgi:hypothetical protein
MTLHKILFYASARFAGNLFRRKFVQREHPKSKTGTLLVTLLQQEADRKEGPKTRIVFSVICQTADRVSTEGGVRFIEGA